MPRCFGDDIRIIQVSFHSVTVCFLFCTHSLREEIEKMIKRVEKGEMLLFKRREIRALLLWKTQQYEDPWRDLVVPATVNKSKTYTEEEDRWLVCMTARCGYGEWDFIRAQLVRSWEFRFNWFFKSRNAAEVSATAPTQISLLLTDTQIVATTCRCSGSSH